MEYLTLDQKKKSLNIRVNDMKLDGSLSINGGEYSVDSLYQYRVYLTLHADFISPAGELVLATVTTLGKIVTVDIESFDIIATISATSRVRVRLPVDVFRYSSYLSLYTLNSAPSVIGLASAQTLNSGNVGRIMEYSGIDGSGFTVPVGGILDFDQVSLTLMTE